MRTGPDGRPVYARAWPVDQPTATLTASETRALVVPVEGRDGKTAAPVGVPLRTQSTRAEAALVVPTGGTWNKEARPSSEPSRARTTREGIAFIAELRGGGSVARDVAQPLATVTASGNHHMLVRHNSSTGDGREMCTPVTEPAHTLTTTGHQSLVGWPPEQPREDQPSELPAVEDCSFRMLEPAEIQAAMAFRSDYQVHGTRRERVRQLGNAVTPPSHPSRRRLAGRFGMSKGLTGWITTLIRFEPSSVNTRVVTDRTLSAKIGTHHIVTGVAHAYRRARHCRHRFAEHGRRVLVDADVGSAGRDERRHRTD